MRFSKQSRSKKGRVAPISDEEGDDNSRNNFHHANQCIDARQESRGVSFTTPRGKIWLILVINLVIVTAFIFMSSLRFPSLYGESVVNDALEQDYQHTGPVIKHEDQASTLATAKPADSDAAKTDKSNRPVGYAKLTSTDDPETSDEETGAIQTETEILTVSSDEISVDTFVKPSAEEENPVQSLSAVTFTPQETRFSSSSADSIKNPEFTNTKAELSSTTSTSTLQSEATLEIQPTSNAYLDKLSVWLAADSGVEVENLAMCLASSGDDISVCSVISWSSQVVNAEIYPTDSIIFYPTSPQQRPVWLPIGSDTYNQLPTVYFSCPMITELVRVHESMTLLFVISPSSIESGAGQKFFGNSPYGQFALHGGKPSFFANNGLVKSDNVLPIGELSLVTYRLHSSYVEIKVNGGLWGGESQVKSDTDERHVRITMNDVVSLGNSEKACDTNAFHGRIAELLVYDAVLNDANVDVVEKYLHGKWWGHKPFPKSAVETAAPDPVSDAPRENADDLSELHPSDSDPLSKPPHDEDKDTTDSTADQSTELMSNYSKSEPTVAEETSHTEIPVDDDDTTTPAPKFDPRVNIFEWKPTKGETSTKNAEQWTRTVKEKVNYIRNFQLGGDVLRALIRQHKDELIALREELFG